MLGNFNNRIQILSNALDASWKRNEVISNNIANVNTPNYKKSYVEFEELLKKSMDNSSIRGKITHQNHIPIGSKSLHDVKHEVKTTKNFSTRRDKNNVDIDVEMASLAKNQIMYNALISSVNGGLQRIKSVIKG